MLVACWLSLSGVALAEEPSTEEKNFELPYPTLTVAAGYAPVMGKGFGGMVQAMYPHVSIEGGLGLRPRQPDPLLGWGFSAAGYLKDNGEGAYLELGLASLYLTVTGETGSREESLAAAPYALVGYRTYLVEKETWALPASISGGAYRHTQRGTDIHHIGWIFGVTLGAQINVGPILAER